MKYSRFLNENKKLIATAAEPNPRAVKRLINYFIVSAGIYSHYPSLKLKPLLISQVIKLRWPNFSLFALDEKFREIVFKAVDITPEKEKISLIMKLFQTQTKIRLVKNSYLWELLKNERKSLSEINNWRLYHYASEISSEYQKKYPVPNH